MNTNDLQNEQLRAVADYLTLQYGSVIFASLAYIAFVLAFLSALFGLRRTAFLWFFVAGACSFLVPTPLTVYASPAMMVLSVVAIIFTSFMKKPTVTSTSSSPEATPRA